MDSHTGYTLNIKQLFPPCVITECCRITEAAYNLYPEERHVVRNAVAKRQREFGAGRECARRTLARLGISDCLLTKGPDGSPTWPDGIRGAISHSHTWCGAAVAWSHEIGGIGFDIETIKRVSLDIARKILTDEEMHWVTCHLSDEQAQKWLALIFSAKESIYKCIAPRSRKNIGFHDAVITPHPEKLLFDITVNKKISAIIPGGASFTGRYLLHDGNVFTGIVLA